MIIWQTYRNADMIEGRGPFVPDRAFVHKKHAAAYIDAQEVVMGHRAKWSEEKFGDWYMRPVEVLEYEYEKSERRKEELKEQALSKLTQQEIEILGLLKEVK
jgi:hypothetical protein